MPRALGLTAIVAVMALLVAACGGDDPTPTPRPTATPVPAAATATPSDSGTTTPTATPRPVVVAPTATPQPVSFDGKTVRITVGFAPGGGFDTFARIFAVHLKDALPGSPTVIVANLPGANTLVAAKATINREVRDNTVDIVLVIDTLVTGAVLGTVDFDHSALTYLGAPDLAPSENTWCARTSVLDNIDDFLSGGPWTVAQIGTTDGYGLNSSWGTDRGMPFSLVYGYTGTSDMNAAFNRGEVDITPTCRQSEVLLNPDWATGYATPLFYTTKEPKWVTEGKAAGKWPWVTDIHEFAAENFDASELEVDTMRSLNKLSEATRIFATPSATNPAVVAALEAAFADIVVSEPFLADMDARGLDVGLLKGDVYTASLDSINDFSAEAL
ncbi:MAG: hypothetical protein V3S98_08330, partial [Dehalococcoidia bacterium]